jgi:hypothetical protein
MNLFFFGLAESKKVHGTDTIFFIFAIFLRLFLGNFGAYTSFWIICSSFCMIVTAIRPNSLKSKENVYDTLFVTCKEVALKKGCSAL